MRHLLFCLVLIVMVKNTWSQFYVYCYRHKCPPDSFCDPTRWHCRCKNDPNRYPKPSFNYPGIYDPTDYPHIPGGYDDPHSGEDYDYYNDPTTTTSKPYQINYGCDDDDDDFPPKHPKIHG